MGVETNQGAPDRSVFGSGLSTADKNARKVFDAFRDEAFGKLRLTPFYRVDKRVMWRCECACGGVRYVHIASLKSGNAKSCGCARQDNRQQAAETATKHGLCDSPTWKSFQAMHQRCLNPKAKHYDDYGGRGITIAPSWLRNFEAFVASMGLRPPGTTLDRIEGDGNYEPGNCRWATPDEQARNRRGVRKLTHGGRTMTSAEWARELGMKKGTLHQRLKLGWTVEEALTRKVRDDGKGR